MLFLPRALNNDLTSAPILQNIRFNTTKSQCLIVDSKQKVVSRPSFRLCSGILRSYRILKDNKYPGLVINSELKDDPNIIKVQTMLELI